MDMLFTAFILSRDDTVKDRFVPQKTLPASVSNPASVDGARQLRAGIRLAFDAANAQGGVNGNREKLSTKEDSLDATKMVTLAAKLSADPSILGSVVFLNTVGLTALSTSDFFGKNLIALVAPLQGNRSIVESRNVYPFRSGSNNEVIAILKEAQATYRQRFAVVHHNVAFGPPK